MRGPFFIPLERKTTAEGLEGRARIPSESFWFSGHFPSNPIFPALGMMGLLDRLLEERAPSPGPLPGIAGRQYKRIRFRQIVRPGEELFLAVSPGAEGAKTRWRFRILKESETISEGVVVTDAPSPEGSPEPASGCCRIVDRAEVPIRELIPHRDRMCLVDEFAGHDQAGYGITRTTVRETWPLCDGEAANPHVMIELVAQATAAMAGWDKFKGGKQLGFGYIVGIKNASLRLAPLPVGTRLVMRTTKLVTQDNYGVFSGTVHRDGRTLADVVLQVFQPGV